MAKRRSLSDRLLNVITSIHNKILENNIANDYRNIHGHAPSVPANSWIHPFPQGDGTVGITVVLWRALSTVPSPCPFPRAFAKSELRGASRQGMNPLARKRKPLSGLGRDDVRRDATLILPAISPQTVLCPSESFVPAPIGAFCSEPGNSFPGALAHDDSDSAIALPFPASFLHFVTNSCDLVTA